MRLLIVRHGDPDYDRDSLTEKGWREAEYLSQKLKDIQVKEFYVSPLGRARDTASCTLEKLGRQGVECEWLQEFTPRISQSSGASAGIGCPRTGWRRRAISTMIPGISRRFCGRAE